MAVIRIGTFNVENLFFRYVKRDKELISGRGVSEDKLVTLSFDRVIEDSSVVGKASRELTARVILENDPDILAVQEVENLEVLDRFSRDFLKKRYPYSMCIDGNDPRLIDVGLLSKHPLGAVRTDRFHPPRSGVRRRTFSRDCLDVEVLLPGAAGSRVRVLVNHFKSRIVRDGDDGTARRMTQAKRVRELVREALNDTPYVVVAGDLNAAPHDPELRPLLRGLGLENVLDRLPKEARWTHYFKRAKAPRLPNEQLDYLLMSPALSAAAVGEPIVERRGLPPDIVKRVNAAAEALGGAIRPFRRPDKPDASGFNEASDHCAIFVDVDI